MASPLQHEVDRERHSWATSAGGGRSWLDLVIDVADALGVALIPRPLFGAATRTPGNVSLSASPPGPGFGAREEK